MRFFFRVPIHGSVLLLAFLSLPYLFAALSLGILISSKAASQAEAMQLAFLPILPSVFFSGYIFPRETMPAIFRPISYFIPATYFINITRGMILRGARHPSSMDRRPGAVCDRNVSSDRSGAALSEQSDLRVAS